MLLSLFTIHVLFASTVETQYITKAALIFLYLSIHAFCDMLAGKDYQDINAKYRLEVSTSRFICIIDVDGCVGPERHDAAMYN